MDAHSSGRRGLAGCTASGGDRLKERREEMDDHQTLLTVPEAAKLLRIGRNLAYELVAQGEIPSVRFGRLIRVPRAALEERLGADSNSSERQAMRGRSGPGQQH